MRDNYSFVICKPTLTSEQIQGFRKFMEENSDDEDSEICESAHHFFGKISKNCFPDIGTLLESLEIDPELFEAGD